MSQPNNSPFGDADCKEMLQIVLDGQATEEQLIYWKNHMGMCDPCFEKFKLDNAIKERIIADCCCSKIPQEVIDQISSNIKQIG